MRGYLITFSTVVAIMASGCDPELGTALADVEEAAPGVCRTFCASWVDCRWTVTSEAQEEIITGDLKEEMLKDARRVCTNQCANRAAHGIFIFEWNHQTRVYTVAEQVSGEAWKRYFKCLWDLGLWECEQEPERMGSYFVQDGTQPQCEARSDCYDHLDIHMRFNWHVQDEYCSRDGAEHFWDGWSGTLSYR